MPVSGSGRRTTVPLKFRAVKRSLADFLEKLFARTRAQDRLVCRAERGEHLCEPLQGGVRACGKNKVEAAESAWTSFSRSSISTRESKNKALHSGRASFGPANHST